MKIGIGYDVHKLTQGRKLILGGVEIPHSHGLDGHSDADVLTHAISDAILGAAKLGDIGKHFPDTDPQFKNADSLKLLEHVVSLVSKKYNIVDIDSVIVAQAPKLSPYREQMEQNLSKITNTTVGVKATTTEGTGPEGNFETISAQAVCLLEEKC